MARTRIPDPDSGGILMGCGVCGNAYNFPFEIRLYDDGIFRCDFSCAEPVTNSEYWRRESQARQRRDEQLPLVNLGTTPTGF